MRPLDDLDLDSETDRLDCAGVFLCDEDDSLPATLVDETLRPVRETLQRHELVYAETPRGVLRSLGEFYERFDALKYASISV